MENVVYAPKRFVTHLRESFARRKKKKEEEREAVEEHLRDIEKESA